MKRCDSCTLCCEVVPVAEIGLAAFTRCPKLHSLPEAKIGCSIYPTRPRGCAIWNCQWLAEDSWPDELRPDRCGVVVDIMPDLILVHGVETPAMQMWVAPGHELAFQHHPILSLVMSIAAQGMAIIWRYRGEDGAQTARIFIRDPETGKLGISPENPPDKNFANNMSTKDRFRRAIQLTEGKLG